MLSCGSPVLSERSPGSFWWSVPRVSSRRSGRRHSRRGALELNFRPVSPASSSASSSAFRASAALCSAWTGNGQGQGSSAVLHGLTRRQLLLPGSAEALVKAQNSRGNGGSCNMISGAWKGNEPLAAAAKPEAVDDTDRAPRHGRDRPRDTHFAASACCSSCRFSSSRQGRQCGNY